MTAQLLEYFRRCANSQGLALASESRLIEALHASPDVLGRALGQLEDEGKVRILSHLPFVALRLIPWSGSGSPHAKKAQQIICNPSPLHEEVPVSSSAAAATHTEDGGAGEGERLLDHVVAILGLSADRDEFRAILAGRSEDLIRRSLRRVQGTKSIRVSRAALFRSLLHKLSR